MLESLLSVEVSVFNGFGMPFDLGPIGTVIKALIDSCSSIGLGIILFTVILKLLTLPLDIFSRVSTRKNSLKMEKLRPQLEKLQRQYANDQNLYNQKMQALYKKEGYSPFSACLPTLVTMVVFIIVIGQFTNYSRYTNLNMINGLAQSYTSAVTAYAEENEATFTVVRDENGDVLAIYVKDDLFNDEYCDDLRESGLIAEVDGETVTYSATDISALAKLMKEYALKGYSYYKVEELFSYNEQDDSYLVKFSSEEDPTGWDRAFIINEIASEKAEKSKTSVEMQQGTVTEEEILQKINQKMTTSLVEYKFDEYVEEKVLPIGRAAAAAYYKDNAPDFLWIKNLWVSDLPWKHPVMNSLSEYDFYQSLNLSATGEAQKEFDEITKYLAEEKSAPNGYLILVVLSIGVMLVSQLVMNKAQKAQMELQSADGQQAQTAKMMTWMMPIMFGVFAFMYTASFSLYMVVSSLLSTGSTLLINYFVEKSFYKKEAQEIENKDKRYKKK